MIEKASSKKTVNVLLVDDENLGLMRLNHSLNKAFNFLVQNNLQYSGLKFQFHEASNGMNALEILNNNSIDIVYIDVSMPEMNGFQVLQNFHGSAPIVVFQTAHAQHALLAFEHNACDYLLKPYSDEKILKSLEKCLSLIKSSKADKIITQRAFPEEEQYLSSLLVKVGNRQKIIEVAEISCIVSENHSSFVFLQDIDYSIDTPLKTLSEKLSPKNFLQIHRNSIVNLKFLKEVRHDTNTQVLLTTGKILKVSRERKKELLERLANISA